MHHVIVHQHLYQPPREDPWLERVRAEPSAAPDHDWNTRINRECYARQAAAVAHRRTEQGVPGDLEAPGGVARVVNLYGWCSFDVGATLCEWLATEAPATLAAMQAGDAASVRRWGHGNAIAAPYHHVILPLASPRERITEIRWGIRDFERRFHRRPEGFWFPECAVDEDTLDAVAAEGIAFTILAPYQVEGHDGRGLPVRWRGASGRTLAIVPYDGSLAGEVAFGGLLRAPQALADRLAPFTPHGHDHDQGSARELRATTLATDGETFGHHHPRGDRALLEALGLVVHRPGVRLTNAAALVASMPPSTDVRLISPSAWSCAHGVERWRSNCGCRLDGQRHPAQQWRGPLRQALAQLADRLHAQYAQEAAALFRADAWAVRDAYGAVVGEDGEALARFVNVHLVEGASERQHQRARELLELCRATLRCFTSCAWFFDDVDRLEVRQVLRYAARALELSGHAARWTPEFVQSLSAATSGAPGAPSAADVFVRDALPHRDPVCVVAAAAIASAANGERLRRFAAYDCETHRHPDGAWEVHLRHRRTGAVARFTGRVEGSGPGLVVKLGASDGPRDGWQTLRVDELPEPIAVSLLAAHATQDDALTT